MQTNKYKKQIYRGITLAKLLHVKGGKNHERIDEGIK